MTGEESGEVVGRSWLLELLGYYLQMMFGTAIFAAVGYQIGHVWGPVPMELAIAAGGLTFLVMVHITGVGP